MLVDKVLRLSNIPDIWNAIKSRVVLKTALSNTPSASTTTAATPAGVQAAISADRVNMPQTKYATYRDNTPISLDSNAGICMYPTFPTINGYACYCIGGDGEGDLGLLVSANGWIFNTKNYHCEWMGITWQLLYVRNA